MRESTGVNFRIRSETKARVEAVAERYGLTVTDLIRLALNEKLDEIERTGKLEFKIGAPGGGSDGKKGKKGKKRG
jgi:antitoxin component of RelBE/YafQ-DinJ toxin-antitoxin module